MQYSGVGALGDGVSDMGMGFQSGMGFPTWRWGSRHRDGVPDSEKSKFPLQGEETFGDDI